MYSLLYITIGSKSEAVKLAEILVSEQLAACVNIIDNVISVYESEQKIAQSPEAIMLVKVNKHSVNLCKRKIEELHSYKIPCIAEIKLNGLNDCFAGWVDQKINVSECLADYTFSKRLQKQLKHVKKDTERLNVTFEFLNDICGDNKINKLTEFDIAEAIMCIDDLLPLWEAETRTKALIMRDRLHHQQNIILKKDSIWQLIKKYFGAKA